MVGLGFGWVGVGWVFSLCVKDVGSRSKFDPSRPLDTQDTSLSVKSSLTAVRQGAKVPSSEAKVPSSDIFALCGVDEIYFVSIIVLG